MVSSSLGISILVGEINYIYIITIHIYPSLWPIANQEKLQEIVGIQTHLEEF